MSNLTFSVIGLLVCIGSLQSAGSIQSENSTSDVELVSKAAEIWSAQLESKKYQNFRAEIFVKKSIGEKNIEFFRKESLFRWVSRKSNHHQEWGSAKEGQMFLIRLDPTGTTKLHTAVSGEMSTPFPPIASGTLEYATYFGFFVVGSELTIPESIRKAIDSNQLRTTAVGDSIEFDFGQDFFKISGRVRKFSTPEIVEFSVNYDQGDCPFFIERGVKKGRPYSMNVKDIVWDRSGNVPYIKSMVFQQRHFQEDQYSTQLETKKIDFGSVIQDDLAQTIVPDLTKIKVGDAHFDCIIEGGIIKPAIDEIPELPGSLRYQNRIPSWGWIFAILGTVLLFGAWLLWRKSGTI